MMGGTLLRGLPPIVVPGARVLLLGSFPGERSLGAREYYANPHNRFWPALAPHPAIRTIAFNGKSPSGYFDRLVVARGA